MPTPKFHPHDCVKFHEKFRDTEDRQRRGGAISRVRIDPFYGPQYELEGYKDVWWHESNLLPGDPTKTEADTRTIHTLTNTETVK